jgi:hypothetical protein
MRRPPLFLALLLFAGCTDVERSSSVSQESLATATTATTATTAATATTTTATTATADTLVSTIAPAPRQVGWVQEPVGPTNSAYGGVDIIAFAPEGQAVAFSIVDTSCCSNEVVGWARSENGVWSSIDSDRAGFIIGADGTGAYGGPTSVMWVNDRFVATGTRGGQVEPEVLPTSTIWTSANGLDWTAADTQASDPRSTATIVGLTRSVDGVSLVAAWMTDGREIELRSTEDGVSWATVGSVSTRGETAGAPKATIVGPSLVTVMIGTNQPRYLLKGGLSFEQEGMWLTEPYLAMSADGATWTTIELTQSPQLALPDGSLSTVVTQVAELNGNLLVYGESYTEGTESSEQVGWRSADGTTFEPVSIATGCGGILTSVAPDKPAPEPTMFGICSIADGPREGDYVATRTQLVISRDGSTFEAAPAIPADWGSPSVDTALGPVVVSRNGAITVAVTQPGVGDRRDVSLWVTP